MNTNPLTTKKWNWETWLQLFFWGIVCLLTAAIYRSLMIQYTQADIHEPGNYRHTAALLAESISYSQYEFSTFLLASVLFEPWFAYKRKSINLSLIYVITILVLCLAVNLHQVVSSREAGYVIYKGSWYFHALAVLGFALVVYQGYRLFMEIRQQQRDLLVSRLLMFGALMYISFNVFFDRAYMISALATMELQPSSRFEVAAENEDVGYVKYLVDEEKLDINCRSSEHNDTPLMSAIRYHYRDRHDVIQYLARNGSDLSLKDNNGNTALMIAVLKYEDPEIIRVLLRAGADIHATNNSGQSPFSIVQEHPSPLTSVILEWHKRSSNQNTKANTHPRKDAPQ